MEGWIHSWLLDLVFEKEVSAMGFSASEIGTRECEKSHLVAAGAP
jgi:hypothetical protein